MCTPSTPVQGRDCHYYKRVKTSEDGTLWVYLSSWAWGVLLGWEPCPWVNACTYCVLQQWALHIIWVHVWLVTCVYSFCACVYSVTLKKLPDEYHGRFYCIPLVSIQNHIIQLYFIKIIYLLYNTVCAYSWTHSSQSQYEMHADRHSTWCIPILPLPSLIHGSSLPVF